MISSFSHINTYIFLCFCLFLTNMHSSLGTFPPRSKETHLHFYAHETFTGPDATTVVIVRLNHTQPFGTIRVYDKELRKGPGRDSKLIGRSQGTVTTASKVEEANLLATNLVFTDGKYNGSTIAVFGRAVFTSDVWNLNIIGGTGEFLLARGYATTKKVVEIKGVYLVLEFNLWFKQY